MNRAGRRRQRLLLAERSDSDGKTLIACWLTHLVDRQASAPIYQMNWFTTSSCQQSPDSDMYWTASMKSFGNALVDMSLARRKNMIF